MAHRAPRGSRRRTGWAELPGQRAGLGRKEREVTLLLPRHPHWQGVWGEQEATAARLPSTARPQRPEEGRRRGITGPETLPKPRTHSHICTPCKVKIASEWILCPLASPPAKPPCHPGFLDLAFCSCLNQPPPPAHALPPSLLALGPGLVGWVPEGREGRELSAGQFGSDIPPPQTQMR